MTVMPSTYNQNDSLSDADKANQVSATQGSPIKTCKKIKRSSLPLSRIILPQKHLPFSLTYYLPRHTCSSHKVKKTIIIK